MILTSRNGIISLISINLQVSNTNSQFLLAIARVVYYPHIETAYLSGNSRTERARHFTKNVTK